MDTNIVQENIKGIRKEFFAFRNGIVADKLRKAGDPHTMIMGCLLVDMTAIARRIAEGLDENTRAAVAQELWKVADNLCHKLLRHIDGSDALFRQLIADDKPLIKYTGYRLLLNLLLTGKVQPSASLRAIVEHEAAQSQQSLTGLLNDILEELDCR